MQAVPLHARGKCRSMGPLLFAGVKRIGLQTALDAGCCFAKAAGTSRPVVASKLRLGYEAVTGFETPLASIQPQIELFQL